MPKLIRAAFLVVALCALGCGGGSGGAAAPRATPTPVGQNWNLYGSSRASYLVPYASPTPAFGTQMSGANLHVNIVVCDSQQHCTPEHNTALDTGSRGLWLPASIFPSAIPSALSTPGYIFYNSDGLQLQGHWSSLSVTFPDGVPTGGASSPAAATVPVLLVSQACSLPGNWPEGTNPSPAACSTPGPGSGQMGIGFDRTGYGTCPEGNPTPVPNQNPNVPTCAATPAANQNYNPLLNVAAMQNGKMVSGYILTQNGVVLGLTIANTNPDPNLTGPDNFAFEKLVPTGLTQIPNSPPDWQPATGSISINNVSNTSGQAVIDIGIGDMLVGPPTPVASTTPVPAGLSANVTLLGLPPGTVGYNFVTGDDSGKNPLAPTVSKEVPTGANFSPYQQIAYPGNENHFAFLNTGINPLNAFNYLYDAQNGYLGLQLNTDSTLLSPLR
ncbi:MAG: hypothetical protein ACLQDV_12340 [Candidatus Binataceae bacterium]